MAWIKTIPFADASEELKKALESQQGLYPREYRREPGDPGEPGEQSESIVASHTLIPEALHHAFATFGSLLSPSLPLSRAQHEMITTRVSALNRDAIPTAADFILRREDIDTVLVYGIVDDRVDGSLRTSRASVDPAQFMQNAFGSDNSGRPYGGGRADMGGFQIPLGMLGETSEEEALWKLVREMVTRRIARVVPDLEKKLAEDSKVKG